jgi:hypothetical protein
MRVMVNQRFSNPMEDSCRTFVRNRLLIRCAYYFLDRSENWCGVVNDGDCVKVRSDDAGKQYQKT